MDPTEWNLGHHYAHELVRYLPWLDHDIDVVKRNYGNKRPDIIFHKRGTNALNFLVVEMKRVEGDKESDLEKIQDDWMQPPLSYRYGAYVNIWARNAYKAVLFSQSGTERRISSAREPRLARLAPVAPYDAPSQKSRRVARDYRFSGESPDDMTNLLTKVVSAYRDP